MDSSKVISKVVILLWYHYYDFVIVIIIIKMIKLIITISQAFMINGFFWCSKYLWYLYMFLYFWWCCVIFALFQKSANLSETLGPRRLPKNRFPQKSPRSALLSLANGHPSQPPGITCQDLMPTGFILMLTGEWKERRVCELNLMFLQHYHLTWRKWQIKVVTVKLVCFYQLKVTTNIKGCSRHMSKLVNSFLWTTFSEQIPT